MAEFSCSTPKENLKVIPCLACLSETELKLALIAVMNDLFGEYSLPADVPTLLEDSACYACLSKKQLLQVMVTIWATIAYDQRAVTVEEIKAKIKCLQCANPDQINAMIAQVTCGIITYTT